MTELTVKVITERVVKLPTLPNFIRTNDSTDAIPLREFTQDQLRDIGQAWTSALMEKARNSK